MLSSAISTIDKYNMISIKDRLVIGVSGGPDSMALLHILYTLKEKYELYIHAAHLNHMLRGAESEEDTAYVKDFCRRFDIPCTVRYVDINKMCEEKGLSSEEAGRLARYDLFCDLAKEIKAHKIALAHNMNDQAETILMRMMRGSGLDGLTGIKPVRDGLYIRPLLFTLRHDIENYCRVNNLMPRIDSTNLEPIYSRNKIRLQLIPYIRENYCPNIESLLSNMAELLREDSDFLEEQVRSIYEKITSDVNDGVSIEVESIVRLHGAVKKRILRMAIENVKGNLTGIESKHIELILSIIKNGATGAAVELPQGLKAVIIYKHLNIKKPSGETNDKFHYSLKIPGHTAIDETGGIMCVEVIDRGDVDNYNDCKFIKYLDYDKIKGNLAIRSRGEGDYIVPLGMRGRKKLKEFFIDNKIPKEDRLSIPLIAIDREILWIVGYKISDNYKITDDTKKVLKLHYIKPGGNNNAK